MKKVLASLVLVGALLGSLAGTALANPHEAGGSGKWQGSAAPCKADGADKWCPPHND